MISLITNSEQLAKSNMNRSSLAYYNRANYKCTYAQHIHQQN